MANLAKTVLEKHLKMIHTLRRILERYRRRGFAVLDFAGQHNKAQPSEAHRM
jgi:acetolactate synthase regulatory subunit